MLARSLLLVSVVALWSPPIPVAAQTSRQVLKGDSVAVYNLVGELRVDAGSGSDVVVEIERGGADAAKLDVQSGPRCGLEPLRIIYPDDVISMPEWGRGWNTTLRVRDDGTFGDEHGRHDRGGWFRDGHEVRITGRGRGGLQAYADLRVSIPKGKNVALYLGVGKAFVSNVEGVIRVWVASADVAADRTRGTLRVETGSGNVDLRTGSGDISLSSGSGDITVSGVYGASAKLETRSGQVTLTDAKAPTVHVETGSGSIDPSPPAGDERSFQTGSGAVEVAPAAIFRSLHTGTGPGGVTANRPPPAA